MRIQEALRAVVVGMAISRYAWGDAGKVVRAERSATRGRWDGRRSMVAVGPRDMDEDDLSADDWFVVSAVH